jgi:hypothetical protein
MLRAPDAPEEELPDSSSTKPLASADEPDPSSSEPLAADVDDPETTATVPDEREDTPDET